MTEEIKKWISDQAGKYAMKFNEKEKDRMEIPNAVVSNVQRIAFTRGATALYNKIGQQHIEDDPDYSDKQELQELRSIVKQKDEEIEYWKAKHDLTANSLIKELEQYRNQNPGIN